MLKYSRRYVMYHPTILVASVFVVACSSGGDDGPQMTDPSANQGTEVEGGEVLIDGPAPQTPLVNSSSARAISIESLELADALVFNFSAVPNAILAAESDASICASEGSVTVSNESDGRSYVFESCKLFADHDALLNGQIALQGSFDNGFSGTQALTGFSATSGLRTVSTDGSVTIEILSGNTDASNAELVINDSQADAILKNSVFSIDSPSTENQSVKLELTVDMSRFGFSDATINSSGLTGERVSCPQAGLLTVNAGDNGLLTVEGSEGENQSYTVDGVTDTLACTEIASIFDESSGETLKPPPAPDSN